MSRPTTPTTSTTTASSSSKEQGQAPSNLPSYLSKEILDTFEDVARFKGWYRQPSNNDRRPCLVTSDLYELITEGDSKFPLYWAGDNRMMSVPIVDAARKEEAYAILDSKKMTQTVVLN